VEDSGIGRTIWIFWYRKMAWNVCKSTSHRYLMTRLSLQVFYLWRHVSSSAPPLILWWSNLEILFGPLHRSSPCIGGLRSQAIQMELGPYIAERTQKAVYIVRCLWYQKKPVCHACRIIWLLAHQYRETQIRKLFFFVLSHFFFFTDTYGYVHSVAEPDKFSETLRQKNRSRIFLFPTHVAFPEP
jgi:hypothetical protein